MRISRTKFAWQHSTAFAIGYYLRSYGSSADSGELHYRTISA